MVRNAAFACVASWSRTSRKTRAGAGLQRLRRKRRRSGKAWWIVASDVARGRGRGSFSASLPVDHHHYHLSIRWQPLRPEEDDHLPSFPCCLPVVVETRQSSLVRYNTLYVMPSAWMRWPVCVVFEATPAAKKKKRAPGVRAFGATGGQWARRRRLRHAGGQPMQGKKKSRVRMDGD